MEDLALVYTPGVAEACREIVRNPDSIYDITCKHNTVAVVTDGTAVLGLGDIGPHAGLPVMEGKCCLFKRFAGIDAFPICLQSKDPDVIVETVALLSPSFGGINLEDIAAPRCFEVERRLQERLDIPVFHDDQHGTAVIVLAGLWNALKVVGKDLKSAKIVVNGMGAAGVAIVKILLRSGATRLVCCDRYGILDAFDPRLNEEQRKIALSTNPQRLKGPLALALADADVFIGVSRPGVVTSEMVQSMAPNAILFALANPTPEIFPQEARAAGAAIIATGRSDFPNQVNNCLGFPGLFRGALDVRACCINEEMKLAAARALSSLITEKELNPQRILPEVMDSRVVPTIAEAVAAAARQSGVARK